MGVAIYVPGVDYSRKNLGTVTLVGSTPVRSLAVVGPASVAGSALFQCEFTPIFTTERGVSWSITSGGAYATIDQNGLVSGTASASGQSVTIRATSTADPSLYAEKTVTVTGDIEYWDYLENQNTARIFIPLSGYRSQGITNAVTVTLIATLDTPNGYMFQTQYADGQGATTIAAYLRNTGEMAYVCGRSGYSGAVTKVPGVKYKYVWTVSGYGVSASSIALYNADTDELLYSAGGSWDAYINGDIGLFSFMRNTAGMGTEARWSLPCVGRLYRFTIRNAAGTLIDMVPISSAGNGGLLDTVSGAVYFNNNTEGTFTYGNES